MSTVDSFDFFNFYPRYKWTAADFENFEQNELYALKALARRYPSAILRGYDFNSAVLFSMVVNAGLAVDVNGFPLHKSSNVSGISVGAPTISQGRWSLCVARRVLTNINPITDPSNPSNTVYLNTREECSIVVIDGTLGASAYPSKQAGDVILFGMKLPIGATTVLSSYIDYTVSEYPAKANDDYKSLTKYDAIVGSSRFCTHADINAVMADANIANIKEILVVDNMTINSPQIINQPDKRITFKAGVTFVKGTSASGVVAQATGVEVLHGRFQDFSGVSDMALIYNPGADYGLVMGTRFKNCTIPVQNDTVNGINVIATHVEA